MRRTAAVLLIEGGPNDGQMIPLAAGANIMGREAINDIVDTDVGVSRKHAEIIETADGHYLRDLSSSHGTFVNGNRIGGHALADGDRIQLGPSTVVFVFRSDWAQTAQFTIPKEP